MISERVAKLCQAAGSVSDDFAQNPGTAPADLALRRYGKSNALEEEVNQHHGPQIHQQHHLPPSKTGLDEDNVSAAELDNARRCGKWGPTAPSDFFLKVYHDALTCLNPDVLIGMVSPSLMGSYGTMPLTVIAPLADIARHMSNLIVRAEREVFLITCAWSPSVAQALISEALKELSIRTGRRNQRVTVKFMYDKAGPAHFIKNRQVVAPSVYSGSVNFLSSSRFFGIFFLHEKRSVY